LIPSANSESLAIFALVAIPLLAPRIALATFEDCRLPLEAKIHVVDMAFKDPEQTHSSRIPPQLFVSTPNNNPMDYGAVSRPQGHVTKKFVLCFDGTGNKFSGTDADSNILKIYRMLDRNGDDQFHYYQPGIGTYVTKANGSMTRTGRWEKFQSWYAKAKDSAVGMLQEFGYVIYAV